MKQRLVLTVVASAILAACGGGGGGGETGGVVSAASTSPAAPAAVPETSTTASDAAYGHFERLNEVRSAMGLAALRWNGSLAAAAQGHARWQSENNMLGHGQIPGTPRFVASGYGERAAAAGYAGNLVGEVIVGGEAASRDDGRRMMDTLLIAPGHRFVLLGIEFNDVGMGSLPLTTNVGQAASSWIAPGRLLAYPYDGQTQVTSSFAPASELPNPLPGVALTGTPLSVHTGMFSNFVVTEARLVNKATGAEVPLLANPDIGQVRSAFVAYPAGRLAGATAYTFSVKALAGGLPREISSTFTTGDM
ncbi:MAG: CAP domain-containing protein [Burkholderiaceae bacterium]